MSRTRRQALQAELETGPLSFDALRDAVSATVKDLEDDLRHLDRSLRREGRRIRVEESRCVTCSFRFKDRAPRRFAPPGRCPRCRSEGILGPWLQV